MEEKRKTVQINCGQAIILNETLGELGGFDGGMINTGNIVVTKEAYQRLMEKGFSINSGSINIIEIKGKAILFQQGEQLLHASKEELAGNYILIEGDLILPASKFNDFSQIEGLYVGGTLYYPESFSLSSITGLKAKKIQQYPNEGVFFFVKNVDLTEEGFLKLEKGNTYIVRGTLEITDASLKQLQNNRSIRFIARRLIIKEEYVSLFESTTAERRTLIPKGHELAKEDVTLTPATYALYGDKLYIKGDLLVQPRGVKCLDKFTSIIVQGEAKLTMEAVAPFKKIGKGAQIEVFEGELKEIDGEMTYSHDALVGMSHMGGIYTLWVNGCLSFDETVMPQDLEAFASITCNGVVAAPPALMGPVHQKIEELNGSFVPYEKSAMESIEGLAKKMNDDGAMINTGKVTIV